jgi:hypothetical protein
MAVGATDIRIQLCCKRWLLVRMLLQPPAKAVIPRMPDFATFYEQVGGDQSIVIAEVSSVALCVAGEHSKCFVLSL